ncbi:MAG: response regulator transcription factor [Firmicutes bacterium]|nr:response regulator transcription factor [Bacillota bacterium]
MKVLLADDHPIFRQGLRSLLEKDSAVEIIEESGDGLEAVRLIDKLDPDMVIIDIEMPGINGLEATYQIKKKNPNTKVIVLSMHANGVYARQALKNGANGYVVKDSAYEELKLAMDAAQKNKVFLSPAVLQPVVDDFLSQPQQDVAQKAYENLSSREREVFQLYARGHSRKEIANLLFISPKTVDRHKGSIKEKLRLTNDAEMLRFAEKIGLQQNDKASIE